MVHKIQCLKYILFWIANKTILYLFIHVCFYLLSFPLRLVAQLGKPNLNIYPSYDWSAFGKTTSARGCCLVVVIFMIRLNSQFTWCKGKWGRQNRWYQVSNNAFVYRKMTQAALVKKFGNLLWYWLVKCRDVTLKTLNYRAFRLIRSNLASGGR